MANASAIFDALLKLAKAAAPVVGKGAPEVIQFAESVMEMIDTAVDVFADEDDAELLEERSKLEQRVNDAVDDTVDRLRGDA